MNTDQPKPTTMYDLNKASESPQGSQPKPESGEWTVETVNDLLDYERRNSKAVAEAHNVAIAAAWRKGHADAQAPALERIDELHKQLAAERDLGTTMVGGMMQELADEREESAKWRSEAAKTNKLRQQLSSERGAQHHMKACRALLNVPDDDVLYQAIKDLQEQLAAEREGGQWRIIAENLKTQLDAEREKVGKLTLANNLMSGDNKQLREELDVEREQGVKALTERSFELHECQKQVQRLADQLVGYQGTTASGATPP